MNDENGGKEKEHLAYLEKVGNNFDLKIVSSLST